MHCYSFPGTVSVLFLLIVKDAFQFKFIWHVTMIYSLSECPFDTWRPGKNYQICLPAYFLYTLASNWASHFLKILIFFFILTWNVTYVLTIFFLNDPKTWKEEKNLRWLLSPVPHLEDLDDVSKSRVKDHAHHLHCQLAHREMKRTQFWLLKSKKTSFIF